MTVVDYARYRVAPGRAEALRTAWTSAASDLQADPECLSYEIGVAADDPGLCCVRVVWAAPDHASVAAHGPVGIEPVAVERYTVAATSPALPEKGLPTLYDWAGEAAAVTRLVDAFYDRVERDELLSPFFPGGVGPEHRRHVADWWSEVLGGPAAYTAMGGYPRMLGHHLGLGITAEQRRRFVALLSIAADDAGLPDDPEFRAALVGYAEWATRLAMQNSQPGAEVVREAPVPRWGWGVAPPYLG